MVHISWEKKQVHKGIDTSQILYTKFIIGMLTIQRKHHTMAVTVTDTLVNYCSDLVQGLTPFKRSKVNTCNLARGTCILKEAMNHFVFTKDNVL